MKTEMLLLLGVGAYWLYTKSGPAAMTYPNYQGGPYTPGSSRSTGSGGTTASIPGMPSVGGKGTSVNNPPVGGGSSWNPSPIGVQPGDPGFVGPVDSSTGYVQCLDGSYASDPSQCAENSPGFTCADGSQVFDPSACPENQGYIQCMDGSYTQDPSTCPENQQPATYDTLDPCDPNSYMYDPSQCGSVASDYTDWGYL